VYKSFSLLFKIKKPLFGMLAEARARATGKPEGGGGGGATIFRRGGDSKKGKMGLIGVMLLLLLLLFIFRFRIQLLLFL
jgi:hypothetical protein